MLYWIWLFVGRKKMDRGRKKKKSKDFYMGKGDEIEGLSSVWKLNQNQSCKWCLSRAGPFQLFRKCDYLLNHLDEDREKINSKASKSREETYCTVTGNLKRSQQHQEKQMNIHYILICYLLSVLVVCYVPLPGGGITPYCGYLQSRRQQQVEVFS